MRRSEAVPLASESPSSKRQRQLSEVIRGLVAEFFERELEFPLGVLVTVSDVDLLNDLAEARVGISVLPVSSGEESLALINSAAYELQKHLGSQLKAYRIPRLKFYLDRRMEQADRIGRLLDTLDESS